MPEAVVAQVEHQFEEAEQQRDAATLGMWIFLATEVLLFGGMFLAYTAYRHAYPQAFAEASRHTLIVFGSINTALLLISSTVMAFSVKTAKANQRGLLGVLLLLTASLGAAFLISKGFEYGQEIREGLFPGQRFHIAAADPVHAEMFFYIYWLMTGVHALHVTIGVLLLVFFALRAWFVDAFKNHDTPVDLLGLYWHFVDVVWVFLFPLIYLVDRHS